MQRLAVLSYHKVGVPPPPPKGWESWFYVNEKTFTAQLQWLLDQQWMPIDLDLFLRSLRDPKLLPEKSFFVTFDDGYRSLLDIAMPVMNRMKIPGVVFMPTDYVGTENFWDQRVEPVEPLCTWDELRTLEAHDIAVQAHSASHPALSQVDPGTWREELEKPRRLLEENLRRPVTTFAYPYGDDAKGDPRLMQLVRDAGYVAAFLYNGPAVTLPITDPMRIQRLAMGPDTDFSKVLG